MAQPMVEGVPPIRRLTFPSNNRYKTNSVASRLKTIEGKLNSVDIKVSAFSTDGDARALSVMRQRHRMGVELKTQGDFLIFVLFKVIG